jgi:hypothetical protein
MSAIVEEALSSSVTSHTRPRISDSKSCPVCADSLFAAESSAFGKEGEVSYLWTCETCGCGFVTRHEIKSTFVCS